MRFTGEGRIIFFFFHFGFSEWTTDIYWNDFLGVHVLATSNARRISWSLPLGFLLMIISSSFSFSFSRNFTDFLAYFHDFSPPLLMKYVLLFSCWYLHSWPLAAGCLGVLCVSCMVIHVSYGVRRLMLSNRSPLKYPIASSCYDLYVISVLPSP